MFGLDPFNRLTAVSEILLLLALAAFIGWLLGRLVLAGRIRALRSAIARKEEELERCRQATQTDRVPTHPDWTMPPVVTAPDEELPQLFIPADPLLPSYAQDDTPALVTENAIPAGSPLTDWPLTEAIPAHALPPDSVDSSVSAGNSEDAVLSRIAARAGEINFDRIGRATAAEADDLKDIIGVGPFLERKLHSLGIYTFRQVANFTKEDSDKVNEIIEFFAGRIERDNWVGQAKTFYERKYGKPH